jgi:hypothetical protein
MTSEEAAPPNPQNALPVPEPRTEPPPDLGSVVTTSSATGKPQDEQPARVPDLVARHRGQADRQHDQP